MIFKEKTIVPDSNYSHQRSQEELLTEMFAGLLRKSESFRCSFIRHIYGKIKDQVQTDFTTYKFSAEGISSENHDHDIDGVLRFDVKLEGKNEAGDSFLLCIENKVGDIIHLEQMQRYARFLKDYRSKPGMDANIVMITKSGTYYEDMEKLSKLIDGHLYWNDILKLIDECSFESAVIARKEDVINKIKELGCKFFEWPSCINEFKFSRLNSFNNDIQQFRKNLQQITHPIFRDKAIFQSLGIDYDHAKLNSPASTISYCYIFHPSKGKSFRTGKWGLLSLILWISFGYKVSSLNPLTIGFKRPAIDISLNLPPAEQFFKDSPELTKKYDELCAVLKRLAPAQLIPMIDFETDGITDACGLFFEVKTEFISRMGIWKEAGVFGQIDKFFAEINA